MMEKPRVLKALRWGQHEYASLRYADMPCPSAWDCVGIALHPKWSGNWLHPRDYTNTTRLQAGCLHGCRGAIDAHACRIGKHAAPGCVNGSADMTPGAAQEPPEVYHGHASQEHADSWLVSRLWCVARRSLRMVCHMH